MTNSNLRTENHFDYVKIKLASPERVMEWGQRTLPNGQVVGELTRHGRALQKALRGLFEPRQVSVEAADIEVVGQRPVHQGDSTTKKSELTLEEQITG